MLLSLSVGVAVSIGIAMLRVVTGVSIWYFLVGGYAVALGLSFFVPKIFTARGVRLRRRRFRADDRGVHAAVCHGARATRSAAISCWTRSAWWRWSP